jgi:hypothetical protein
MFDEESVNETVSGAVPDVGKPAKSATGAPADTGGNVIDSRSRRKRDIQKSLPGLCTCLATIKATPNRSKPYYMQN